MILLPSLLSVPFFKLFETLEHLHDLRIKHLHIDIMDGHFVPNLSFCPRLIAEIHTCFPDFFLDVHLMVSPLEQVLPLFKKCGASRLIIHPEADFHPYKALQTIQKWGMQAGLALNPGTHSQVAEPFLEVIDSILVMSVNPGFGGQAFLKSCFKTLSSLRDFSIPLYVDGGITPEHLPLLEESGAHGVVIGQALLGVDKKDLKKRLEDFYHD